MAKQQRIGGTFAPPLTDELLASYRKLIDDVPAKTQLREALETCYACCAKWWELPESTNGSMKPHASGRGTIVDLDAPIAETLWDLIPWEEEIATIDKLFDGIEREIVTRNSTAIAAWHQEVSNQLTAKYFPDKSVLQKLLAAARTAAEWIGLLPPNEQEKLLFQMEQAKKLSGEIADAFAAKRFPGNPYPPLEQVPLRNAAFHLLWHVRELNLDREPITNDKV